MKIQCIDQSIGKKHPKCIQLFKKKLKKGKLISFDYKEFHITRIENELILYIQSKKKVVIIDIAIYDPYHRSLMEHFHYTK